MDEAGGQDNWWKIEVVTWNIAALPPPPNVDLAPIFGRDEDLKEADLIVIGLQEVDYYATRYLSNFVTLHEEPWSARFRDYLAERDYVKVTGGRGTPSRLMGIYLMIFAARKRLMNIAKLETKFCRTGFSGYSSHKGAVSIRLTLTDGSHVSFVCAHFAPFNEALAYRVKEYHMVLNSVQFDNQNVISDDYVFWLGDLNFRVEGFTIEETLQLIQDNYIEKLLEYDQLKRCMASEKAFYHFNEAPITFKPTYKFHIGTDTYDTRRCPSWCDRILWRVVSSQTRQLLCHPLRYDSKSSFTNSDHKPVTARFQIRVFNLDPSPHCNVIFRYPSSVGSWFTDQNNQCQYSIAKHYHPSVFDWIGVYKPGFRSDHDVVTWAYVVTSWEESNDDGTTHTNILFKRQHIPPPGTYLLGYYSRERSCLISLSSTFEVASPSLDDAVEATET